jgi:MFS transporter, NNP family, nitrate/nitrite transporter
LASLVKKSITGQIAGYVCAYRNTGATMFSIVLALTNPAGFFTAIGISSVIAASLFIFCLKEPANSFATGVEGMAVEAEQVAYH